MCNIFLECTTICSNTNWQYVPLCQPRWRERRWWKWWWNGTRKEWKGHGPGWKNHSYSNGTLQGMSLPRSQLPLPLAKRPGAYCLHMHGISQIFRGFMQQQILTVLRYIPRQTSLQEKSGSGMVACLGNSLFVVLLCKLPIVKTNCFQDRAVVIHV